MTRLEEYQAYAEKHGLPDTIAGFSLYNAWQDAEEKNAELKNKVFEYFKIYANEGKVPGWCDRVFKCKRELLLLAND
jgi:hypothetical protein